MVLNLAFSIARARFENIEGYFRCYQEWHYGPKKEEQEVS
jgi:hypothetical protein